MARCSAATVAGTLARPRFGRFDAGSGVPAEQRPAAGLFGITFGLIRGNALGWDSASIVIAFVAGVASLVAFLLSERRSAAPTLELSLFAVRSFSVPDAVGFLMSAGMFGSIFLLTLFI